MIPCNTTVQRFEAWAFGNMSPRHIATKNTEYELHLAISAWFDHYNVPYDERANKYTIKVRTTTETFGDWEVLR